MIFTPRFLSRLSRFFQTNNKTFLTFTVIAAVAVLLSAPELLLRDQGLSRAAAVYNWQRIGTNLDGPALYMRDVAFQGSRMFCTTGGYSLYYSDNGGQLWQDV